MTRERPEQKKVEKSSDEIAREIGFINEQTLSMKREKIRNPKVLMQVRLNSLVQRGIMRIGRRYRVARSSTEEVDAEIS